jgi:hypothetical protein
MEEALRSLYTRTGGQITSRNASQVKPSSRHLKVEITVGHSAHDFLVNDIRRRIRVETPTEQGVRPTRVR